MLVSVNEIRGYMGGLTLSEGQEVVMRDIIAGIQQELETHLNRPVEPVQVRETAVSTAGGFLYLSVTPVWKVIRIGVTRRGEDEPLTPYITPPMQRDPIIGADGRMIDRTKGYNDGPPIMSGGINAGSPGQRFTVEYVGGLLGTAEMAIKLAIKRVVAREWATNHVNTAGLRVGTPQETEVGDGRFLGWSGEELRMLDRYRRRVVVR